MKEQPEQKPRLLVVDDDNAFRSLVRIALSDEGFDVDEAPTGEQALDAVRQKAYDLILLDVKMPGMDGLQVLKLVRQETPSTDVMMITGYNDVSLAVESIKLGAREYLTKPIEADDLIQRVRTSLRAHAAEMRLREIQADFSSRLLYEIRNPLNTAKSAVGFLLKGMAGPVTVQQQEVLSHIDSVSTKVLTLISDMIDLTKFELGRVNLEKRATNLEQLVPAVCNRLEPLARAKKLTLKVNVNPNIPTLELDAEKIEQVVMNLLDNAIKYSNEGGTISVTASIVKQNPDCPSGECAELAITDAGNGIPSEELPYVFDKYKEFLTGKTSAKKTTGIGLAICRSIVEAHKGTMTAESPPGKGSTFKVLLLVNPL